METVTDFIFGGSKVAADGDCSHEIKRRLFLERKAMTSLDRILKGRDLTLPTKVCLVKARVFPVVMYGCESWTIKKAEHWKIDAFELWCCRRLLIVGSQWVGHDWATILNWTVLFSSLSPLILSWIFCKCIWRVVNMTTVHDKTYKLNHICPKGSKN